MSNNKILTENWTWQYKSQKWKLIINFSIEIRNFSIFTTSNIKFLFFGGFFNTWKMEVCVYLYHFISLHKSNFQAQKKLSNCQMNAWRHERRERKYRKIFECFCREMKTKKHRKITICNAIKICYFEDENSLSFHSCIYLDENVKNNETQVKYLMSSRLYSCNKFTRFICENSFPFYLFFPRRHFPLISLIVWKFEQLKRASSSSWMKYFISFR